MSHQFFKKCVISFALVLIASISQAQTPLTPVGLWQTIDDRTNEPKALIEIKEDENGKLFGAIVKGLGKEDLTNRICHACKDYRKNKPLMGMIIINNMEKNGENWMGGTILDPENGSSYKCKISLNEDGQKLTVRGYLGVSLIGRSQTWLRVDK